MEKKIKEYEVGKEILADYLKEMNEVYQEFYNELMNGMDMDEEFEEQKAIKFIRTWNIINKDLKPEERNLFCTFQACGNKSQKCLEVFNGKGGNVKNIGTLRTMIYNIKKKINKIYKEKYNEIYDRDYL
jgi:hypothetical protein